MSQALAGKVALVTGASRGLGKSIAQRLGRVGAKVGVNYFGSAELARATVDSIVAAGGIAIGCKADVRDEAQVREMVQAVTQAFGPVDILVINATGPQPFVTIEKMTWRDCLDQLEFFVKSPLILVQQVLGSMKARRAGRIINIGSEVFDRGVPEFSNYASAKGAQLGLTKSWAMELAPFGITVNLIAPGWIPTERHDSDPQEMKDAYAAAVPMKHMGEHADIAAAVEFLAGEGAKFITGQKISVNGGNTLG